MMPTIIDIGEVIAHRELTYVSDKGTKERATIEIGKPYQFDDEAFVCPYRVGSKSYEHIFGSVGIDSFQALQLALQTMEAELIFWIRQRGGAFEFLGEPGTGLESGSA